MKIHPAFNTTEIAERYYKKIGKFTTRVQARKNFVLLKHPKEEVIRDVIEEIIREQMNMLGVNCSVTVLAKVTERWH